MSSSVTVERLQKRAQFVAVRKGVRAPFPSVQVEACRRDERPVIGFGLTASRKVGAAVVRNRAKRRLREAGRQLLPALGIPGADYVFVARAATADAPWEGLLDDVRNALIRLRASLENAPRNDRNRRSAKPQSPTKSD